MDSDVIRLQWEESLWGRAWGPSTWVESCHNGSVRVGKGQIQEGRKDDSDSLEVKQQDLVKSGWGRSHSSGALASLRESWLLSQ